MGREGSALEVKTKIEQQAQNSYSQEQLTRQTRKELLKTRLETLICPQGMSAEMAHTQGMANSLAGWSVD